MSLLVVGSVALDSVKTPFGEVTDALGGSANYFSLAACQFTDVQIVGVVGEDFPKGHVDFLKTKNIDTRGLVTVPGKTFRWMGEYGDELNDAKTLDTQLGVFADFQPDLPEDYRKAQYVFLANIDPDLQSAVLDQVENPSFVALDTMNFWIEGKLDSLKKALARVDILVINDGEAEMFSGKKNLIEAARWIRKLGPKILVIKRGEYGAVLFYGDKVFAIPAYPLEKVFDPTGAGDSFAGGFIGYLCKAGNLEEENLRRAMLYGSVMASCNVEDFSVERLKNLAPEEVEERAKMFYDLTHFEL